MWRHGRLSVVARALVQHAAVSLVALVLVAAAAAVVCVRLVQSEALREVAASSTPSTGARLIRWPRWRRSPPTCGTGA